jgi:hypothetical protein
MGIRELLLILEFTLGLAAFAGLLLMLGLSLLAMVAAGCRIRGVIFTGTLSRDEVWWDNKNQRTIQC